jgi:hypothetical protein
MVVPPPIAGNAGPPLIPGVCCAYPTWAPNKNNAQKNNPPIPNSGSLRPLVVQGEAVSNHLLFLYIMIVVFLI